MALLLIVIYAMGRDMHRRCDEIETLEDRLIDANDRLWESEKALRAAESARNQALHDNRNLEAKANSERLRADQAEQRLREIESLFMKWDDSDARAGAPL